MLFLIPVTINYSICHQKKINKSGPRFDSLKSFPPDVFVPAIDSGKSLFLFLA